jgi:ABC-type multidrug transport system ATPase subunit
VQLKRAKRIVSCYSSNERSSSAGLDSASTVTIVQSLANLAHATDATIIIALLQPEPQVYDLFDDVLLLANGRIAYQGPRLAVEPHFASLGFECTGRKAVADFLQVRLAQDHSNASVALLNATALPGKGVHKGVRPLVNLKYMPIHTCQAHN